MKRVFELTKREQRLVIVIVATLVAIAFAKHWLETKSNPPVVQKSFPTASPTVHPEEEERDSDDER